MILRTTALCLERRSSERAAAQFEKGTALNPEDAWLQFQSGKACLNLQQVDKATAAVPKPGHFPRRRSVVRRRAFAWLVLGYAWLGVLCAERHREGGAVH